MTKNMYTVAGDSPCNEALTLRIQSGDKNAAERLVSQNEGYLTELTQAYTPWCETEDLKQEAALALLDAAGHFDPTHGTKLLTYATPVMEAAMMDYAAQYSSSLSIPVSRYNQLRRVAYLCAEGCDSSDAELVKVVCGELNVSAKVAGALIKEYRTLLIQRMGGGADAQRVESGAELPRHRPAGRSWHDLSGAGDLPQLQRPQRSGEGVQGRAAETEKGLVWRGLRPVALRTEGHPRRQSGGGAGRGVSLHLNGPPVPYIQKVGNPPKKLPISTLSELW